MKRILQMISLLLSTVLFAVSPITVMAEEVGQEDTHESEVVYYDTEEGRFVNDLDAYLEQLNAGLISPYNSTIIEYDFELVEPGITPNGLIDDPTKSCSNIFGHKWGNWGDWESVQIIEYPNGTSGMVIERWRYCERTYCGAKQKEIDFVWL